LRVLVRCKSGVNPRLQGTLRQTPAASVLGGARWRGPPRPCWTLRSPINSPGPRYRWIQLHQLVHPAPQYWWTIHSSTSSPRPRPQHRAHGGGPARPSTKFTHLLNSRSTIARQRIRSSTKIAHRLTGASAGLIGQQALRHCCCTVGAVLQQRCAELRGCFPPRFTSKIHPSIKFTRQLNSRIN
jgi:hypothetical protein